MCWCSSPFKITYIKHKVQYNRRNTLIILSEHVRGFHPESQSPFGHCPLTLLHLAIFKQWHILIHPSPKEPLSHTVITTHSNNERERFVTENNNCSQLTQNNTISVKQMYYWWKIVLIMHTLTSMFFSKLLDSLMNMKYKSIPLIRIRMGEGFRRPLI